MLAESAIAGKSQSIRSSVPFGRYLIKVAGIEDSSSERQPYTLSLMKELNEEAAAGMDLSEMNMLDCPERSECGNRERVRMGLGSQWRRTLP